MCVEIPKVSVVMSVRNGECYVAESIESILNQSFVDFEFIIIDDGSTDETYNILRRYKSEDKRIVIVSRENKGLPASLNEGILKSRGEYIARMDADDIAHPERLAKQVEYLDKNINIGVLGTWAKSIGSEIKEKIIRLPIHANDMRSMLVFTPCFIHPTVMFRKNILIEYDIYYNESFFNSQDYELWSRLVFVTEVANLPEVLLWYRYHDNSITKKTSLEKFELKKKLLKSIQGEFLQRAGLNLTEAEVEFHFSLLSKDRVYQAGVSIDSLVFYFNKLINFNKESCFFGHHSFKLILMKRFFVVIWYKLSRLDFDLIKLPFHSLFWRGLFWAVITRGKF